MVNQIKRVMKELTIEQKAQRYDEAVINGSRLWESDIITRASYEYMFPELKENESEDEKTMKEMLDYIIKGSESLYDVQQYGKERFEKWIAWLEKQCEHNSFSWTEDDEAKVKAMCKEGNLKPSEREWLKNLRYRVTEKNPTDKVEPKFKVGDWVVYQNNTFRVQSLSNGTLILQGEKYQTYFIEELCRLWTIQDAKDGDVLSDGTTIFIFKDLLSDGSVMSYCDYDTDSDESDALCPLSMNLMCSKITPATKEQRDKLEKAMTDRGYTFDFEKKELKKIEQKPAWSEEDSPYYDDICELLINILHSESRNYNMEAIKKDLDWLKSLRPQVTWKPSEEQIKALDEVYKTHGANNVCRRVLFNLMNDLKKLREE